MRDSKTTLTPLNLPTTPTTKSVQSEGMDQLGNQRRLDYGCYTDASKPLRRKLKQLGSGSVEGGLRACKASEAALVEVCGLMAVDPMVRSHLS